jgi:hypothetical protein
VLRFDWNALLPGDQVLVHGASDMTLSSGVVALVDVLKGSNGVGVRVTTDGRGVILWPSRLAVHSDPCDPTEPCWQCQALLDAGDVRLAPLGLASVG